MTIAVCYLAPEGIVLGADSTSSVTFDSGHHFLDFNQKIFEIGETSTLGLLTWGLGAIDATSYRTLIARLSDELPSKGPKSVLDVANLWTDKVWALYDLMAPRQRALALHAKAKHDPTKADADHRTKDEEDEYFGLVSTYYVGFCLAGYVSPDRNPVAATVMFSVVDGKPTPIASTTEGQQWWGVPNVISRVIKGFDGNLRRDLLASGHWNGTEPELDAVLQQQEYLHSSLPIRDAIDYVHSCIHSTIKAMKFSTLPQVCGGPIEIAVITTDRNFRWVRHKSWDAAIADGAM